MERIKLAAEFNTVHTSGGGGVRERESVTLCNCRHAKLRHVEEPTYDHRKGHTQSRGETTIFLFLYSTYSEIHSAGPRVTWEAWTETPNCLQVVE